jgi:hypothetical protein
VDSAFRLRDSAENAKRVLLDEWREPARLDQSANLAVRAAMDVFVFMSMLVLVLV